MRWGKIKRKLQQKPYLLDPYRVRSRRDARKMLYEQGLPCAAEVLEAARIRAGKSPEEWESLIGMSREKLARKCRAAMPVRFGHVALVSRRAVLGLGVILLLGFFFGFTYPGRALAKTVYNVVCELIENVLYVSSDTNGPVIHTVPVVTGNINEEHEFDTLYDLREYVGYPFYRLTNKDYIIDTILLRRSTHLGDRINVIYQFNDIKVSIYQINLEIAPFCNSFILTEDSNVFTIRLPSGIMVSGAFSPESNSFVGTTTTSTYAVSYVISNCKDEETIASVLESLVLE